MSPGMSSVAPHKARRLRPGTVIAIVLLLALAALTWQLTYKANPAAGASGGRSATGTPGGLGGPNAGRLAPSTTVGVAAAAAVDIPIFVDALGTVIPSATVTVRPQVSGVLTNVLFTEGQSVRAGQVLATIDPRAFELALMQARGQQQRDEALLEAATVTLQRYRTLLEQDSIARQEVDTQAATVKQLQGTLLTNKAAVGTAQLNLAHAKIVAPASGRIGLRTVDPGNVISSTDTGGIAVITQLTPIDVEFALPQDRIPDLQSRLQKGARLAVTAYDRTRAHVLETGVFMALNNQADVETGTVRAKARFSNQRSTLFPSQFVNVRLRLDTLHDTITVPATALRHGPNGDFVYVVNQNGTVTLRKVSAGPSVADRIAIVNSLTLGERVVTEGADGLKDGDRVQLPGVLPRIPADRQ